MREVAYAMIRLLRKSYVVLCVVLTLLIVVSMYAHLHYLLILLEVISLLWTIAKVRAVGTLIDDLEDIELEIQEELRKSA